MAAVGWLTGVPGGLLLGRFLPDEPPSVSAPPGVLTVNNLLFLFPRVANLLSPCLVTAPIIEVIGDCCVTAADPLRILWWARFEACRTEDHFRNSSRRFAVAHLVPH